MFKSLEQEERIDPLVGSSAQHPLVLDDVTTEEFDIFLTDLNVCPLSISLTEAVESVVDDIMIYRERQCRERVVVLKLADRWSFSLLRQSSVRFLRHADLSPQSRLALCDQYKLEAEDWVVPAIRTLVKRNEDLTLEEAQEIGLERALKLMSLRGEHHVTPKPVQVTPSYPLFASPPSLARSSNSSANLSQDVVLDKRIREVFGLPPKGSY
ncbi:hypothetical protein PHLGIDRAFT_457452 [Phlebiopsis gigantea 11061_1 CR5-6]|uniref:Uncharacterized protein n=1 Tax=Phlebiopsis gigantea (strain 11061_1 CR5-6) TaxID=745531 RepID=A0A0C3S622_PHLG1|nr:hypothetical protein PHLGIDRAFT_457452 [Phlebiopsis gigantea 11061_1 CR5-6]